MDNEFLSLLLKDDLDLSELKSKIASLNGDEKEAALLFTSIELRRIKHINAKRDQELYGESTEQIRLFDNRKDDLEENTRKVIEEDEAAQTVVKEHIRKRPKNKRATIDQLPVEESHVYPTDPLYLQHRDECQELAPENIEEIKHIPAVLVNHRTVLHQFAWTDEFGETHIFKAENPNPKLIKGSYVSPSLGAKIITDKVVLCTPIYRQEKYYRSLGLDFSRQTLCNWSIELSEQYLSFLYDRIMKDFSQNAVNHIDETGIEVLENRANGGNKVSTILAGRSGPFEEKQMVVYAYSPTKKAEDFQRILPADYNGVIECDAASSHNFFTNATLAFCLTHARREFVDILRVRTDYRQYEKLKTSEERTAFTEGLKSDGLKTLFSIITSFGALYTIENQSKRLNEGPEEILKRRQEKSVPVFKELTEKISRAADGFNQSQRAESKACSYFLKRVDGLSRFLENGAIPIDNNPAERTVKSFDMARKNFLFSNTERGAKATAIAFTVIQSAILNGLRPEPYLTYVFDTLRREGARDEVIARLLPYSKQLPRELYLDGMAPTDKEQEGQPEE